jgi:multimeric flavodoxin WrbA
MRDVPTSKRSQILIVNGSLSGSQGNTAELLAIAEEHLAERAQVALLELCREPSLDRILEAAHCADGFLFGTGTYWDSWGSPLQKFLEITARTEAQDYWRGKPVAAVVTAHAVGSKGVLSRLLGVCNSYGMLIPPFAGLSYTWANSVALPHASEHLRGELWKPEDISVLCHNLLEAIEGGKDWRCWSVTEGRSDEKWLKVYSERKP